MNCLLTNVQRLSSLQFLIFCILLPNARLFVLHQLQRTRLPIFKMLFLSLVLKTWPPSEGKMLVEHYRLLACNCIFNFCKLTCEVSLTGHPMAPMRVWNFRFEEFCCLDLWFVCSYFPTVRQTRDVTRYNILPYCKVSLCKNYIKNLELVRESIYFRIQFVSKNPRE